MSKTLIIAGVVVFLCVLVANARQSTRRGWVSDAASGAAVAGASLRVTNAGQPTTDAALASTQTGPDGAFDLPTDDIRGVLEVTAPGYATKRQLWPSAADVPEIRLERAATLPVRIVDDIGVPIEARLAITTFHPGNVVVHGVRAAGGVADVANLPSGRTMVIAVAEGMAPAAAIVGIEAGVRYSPLNLALQPAGTIAGTVIERDGTRRPDAEIVVEYGPELTLRAPLSSYLSWRRPVGGDVDFEIRNVIPGAPVRLFAKRAEKRSAVNALVVAAGEQRFGIALVLE